MYLGASLTESVTAQGLPEAVDAWADDAGAYPDLVPIWHPLPAGKPFPMQAMVELRQRGVEPMLYTRSTRNALIDGKRVPDPAWHYRTWLAGDHDDVLDDLANAAAMYDRRLIVRLDHEMSMKWCPWCGLDPALYIDAYSYIAERLRQAPNVKMYWCGWSNRSSEYYPGRACDFIGFDKYSKRATWRPLDEDWRSAIRSMRKLHKSKRIIVGEFGRLSKYDDRHKWIKTVHDVRDVWGCVYFDVGGHGWVMTKWMKKKYMRTR